MKTLALALDYIQKDFSIIPLKPRSKIPLLAIGDVKNTELNEDDVYNIVAKLKPHYQHGNRNDFTMHLSGWMRKESISFESALKVIESISTDDEQKPARIRTL